MMTTETERVRRIWERLASKYDASIDLWERVLFTDGREWVCSQAEGRVLEIAVGTGRNLPFYPAGVQLTGIDFSPSMLAIAGHRAAGLGIDIDLQLGNAEMLEFEDASFDTVVITLALCSIPDSRRAMAEAWRVLRPGGRLLLLEHVRSQPWSVRAVEYFLNFFTVWLAGDHLLRDPLDHLQDVGFIIECLERRRLGIVERIVTLRP